MIPLVVRCRNIITSKNIRQYQKGIHMQKNLSNVNNNIRKTIQRNEDVKSFKSYILTRYMQFVQNYENVIQKKFPKAMHLYRTFKVGMKEFYSDLVTYMKILRILNTTTDGLKSLTLDEIYIYHKMPKDMKKVAPVLLLSALPLTNYIIFPLAYFYPRQLLCSHFWSLQQRSEFQVHYLRFRLLGHRPTFRCLQAELETLRGQKLYDDWGEILGLVGSGVQPTTEQILNCKQLFIEAPYSLQHLKAQHVKNLFNMHSLKGILFRKSKLRDHALILLAMDRAIVREGGTKKLNQESLRTACFLRGLNPSNVRHEDLIEWLDNWLHISNHVNKDSLSLLLHCPILLGYNQPSNWLLIY